MSIITPSSSVAPSASDQHPRSSERGRATARLALAAIAIGSATAVALALRIRVDTGSPASDQAVAVLRTLVVGLSAWLFVSVVLGAWSARTGRSSALPEQKVSATTATTTAVAPLARRIAPRWIQSLAQQAFGAATVVAVLTTSVAGAGAVSRPTGRVSVSVTAPTAPSATARSTMKTTPSMPPVHREALGSGAHESPQLFEIDPSSGQQWPVIKDQALPPETVPSSLPIVSAVPGINRPNISTVPATEATSPRRPAPTTSTTLSTSTTSTSTASSSTTSTSTTSTVAPTPTARTSTTSTSTTSTSTTAPTTPVTSMSASAASTVEGTSAGGRFGPSVPAPVADPARHVVKPGESFWSIAETLVYRAQPRATDHEVSRYWLSLIDANASRLAVPGNPDLLYPGTVLTLPPR